MRAAENALSLLEAAAQKAVLTREEKQQEIEALNERAWAISREAKDAYRPAFQAAVREAAPILEQFLASPEWKRLRVACGRLRGVPTPDSLELPALYIHGNPRRAVPCLSAVFKGEVWSASPYSGGIFRWTVGRHLTLTRKIHYMQPLQVIFQSESELLDLIPWFEKSNFDGMTGPVAMRFCEIVSEGRLVELLAQYRGGLEFGPSS